MRRRPTRSTLFPYTTLFRSFEYEYNGQRIKNPVSGPHVKVFDKDGKHLKDIGVGKFGFEVLDRKSTRLNSSHRTISYAVFCLKTKNKRYRHFTNQSQHAQPT